MQSDLRVLFIVLVAFAMSLVSSICLAADEDAPARSPQTSPATTQSAAASGVSVRVQSARVTRATQQLQKMFANRYVGNDGNPGVSIQLLMTLADATVLPLQREAVAVETFVDDTFQSLLPGPGDQRWAGGSGESPLVSDDGDTVLFTVASGRPVADDATRVFVRGSLEARVVRGKPEVASAPLPLNVGGKAEVGPFKLALKSISDTGRTTALTLSVTGDAGRIRKIRALGKDGRQLNEDRDARVSNQFSTSTDGTTERTSSIVVNIPPAQDNVSLELTYAERVDDVRIPFEVQVDVGGGTKAGPIEPSRRKSPRGAGALRGQVRAGAEARRPWPPLPPGADPDLLPARRAPFDPSTRPSASGPGDASGAEAAGPRITKAAVDMFSLTVSKPPPGEVKGVTWANPPSPSFHATGFTVARLMLSVPDASLLSVAPDGLSISRFEDDKGGKHDTTIFRDDNAMFYGRGGATSTGFVSSPDGRQALLTFSLANAPTPGSTRCTLAGTVHATVTRGDRTDTSDPIPVVKGQKFTAGPLTGTLTMVRQPPALSPAQPTSTGQLELFVNLMGPMTRVRVIEIVDEGGQTVYTHSLQRRAEMNENLNYTNFGFYVQPKVHHLTARVRHYDRTEAVEIPFEISAGVGL